MFFTILLPGHPIVKVDFPGKICKNKEKGDVRMKVVVAIDSFKGSLTSLQAGEAVKEAILRLDDTARVTVKPLADGGEGTVAAFAAYPLPEVTSRSRLQSQQRRQPAASTHSNRTVRTRSVIQL